MNKTRTFTYARSNPPIKGKCDVSFATELQKWRLATQILKSEVLIGDIVNNI
ncbi:MAG: hypothetical protein ORN58_03295 [Sediminibacterium sp.]|nr:hypothetical protein [Sediminibacterium sp.]